MTFWILVGVITLAVAVYVLRPLLRPAASQGARRGDYDLRVYRQQLDDLESDRARGVISEEEARAARIEIERRMLQAARDVEPASGASGRGRIVVGAVVAIALPLLAAALYLEVGSPTLPAQPLAERSGATGRATETAAASGQASPEAQQGLDSIERMVGSLAARLEREPGDYQGWMLLGRSYGVMNRYQDAAEAYARAAALPEGANDPTPHMQLGEALIFAGEGIVTERAKEAFRKALSIDASQPGAQFYLALAKGQAGDLRGAFDGWLKLARNSPPDAPWRPSLHARLREVARDLDIDLAEVYPTALTDPAPAAAPTAPSSPSAETAAIPGPSAEDMRAAAEMAPKERQAMIQGMVQRLADRMAENPDDAEGWMRLGRAYGVLGETAKSAEAYGNVVRLRPDDIQARLAYAGALLEAEGEGPLSPGAVDQFRQVLERDPSNPDALWFLGRADAEAGRADQALEKWRRLLGQLQPGSEAYRNVQGQIERLENAGG